MVHEPKTGTQECPNCGAVQANTRRVCLPKDQGGCGTRMSGESMAEPLSKECLDQVAAVQMGDKSDLLRSSRSN